MTGQVTRRDFLKTSVAATGASLGAAALSSGGSMPAQAGSAPLRIKKAVLLGMLPEKLSYEERFRMARAAGFEAVEAYTTEDQKEAETIQRAAESAQIHIHSVMNMGHWKWPLSSPDPAVVQKSLHSMQVSLHNAHFWGADTVLLVPAVVDSQTTYRQAWQRSQKQIRALIPLAEQLRVVMALEEVWNKFLLSPLEFPRYVDQFQSPWVKSYFDVGNVVLYGYPQDWIRELDKRFVKMHLKDFNRKTNQFVNLGDGSIEWPEVRKALTEVGYNGYATTELDGGDAAYLQDVSKRVDRLVLGI
ncbi:MAG: TIM barrel protein [Terriglobia bacterium]